MPNVYVEARPRAVPREAPIEDFVVEDHADHVLAPSKHRRRHRLARKERPFALAARRGILTTRKYPTIGAPPSALAC